MRVELLYVADCPGCERLRRRLRALLARAGIATPPTLRLIADEHAARSERFLGSPTLRVNGRDVEPGADGRTDYGLTCRVYRTVEGPTDVPADDWILAALTASSSPRPAAPQVSDGPSEAARQPLG